MSRRRHAGGERTEGVLSIRVSTDARPYSVISLFRKEKIGDFNIEESVLQAGRTLERWDGDSISPPAQFERKRISMETHPFSFNIFDVGRTFFRGLCELGISPAVLRPDLSFMTRRVGQVQASARRRFAERSLLFLLHEYGGKRLPFSTCAVPSRIGRAKACLTSIFCPCVPFPAV